MTMCYDECSVAEQLAQSTVVATLMVDREGRLHLVRSVPLPQTNVSDVLDAVQQAIARYRNPEYEPGVVPAEHPTPQELSQVEVEAIKSRIANNTVSWKSLRFVFYGGEPRVINIFRFYAFCDLAKKFRDGGLGYVDGVRVENIFGREVGRDEVDFSGLN